MDKLRVDVSWSILKLANLIMPVCWPTWSKSVSQFCWDKEQTHVNKKKHKWSWFEDDLDMTLYPTCAVLSQEHILLMLASAWAETSWNMVKLCETEAKLKPWLRICTSGSGTGALPVSTFTSKPRSLALRLVEWHRSEGRCCANVPAISPVHLGFPGRVWALVHSLKTSARPCQTGGRFFSQWRISMKMMPQIVTAVVARQDIGQRVHHVLTKTNVSIDSKHLTWYTRRYHDPTNTE